ncbi:hypothetical protein [Vibrio vulnificus]|uniref:hypothetical protein n=1 Tax=Vibrio vulnificus TaxID=672 RepID=UPI001F50B70E|nr:hypothetical protein [Vibrio vulnificus]
MGWFVRFLPLNAGVMLNHLKSVVYGFSLFPRRFSFVFVGKLAFLSAVFSDTYSLALEIQRIASINLLGKREVRAVGSIRNPFLGFKTSN